MHVWHVLTRTQGWPIEMGKISITDSDATRLNWGDQFWICNTPQV